MNTLQRFEDISITVTLVATARFMQELKDTADIISGEKKLLFLNKVKAKSLSIDAEIVMQVYENLLSNAVRSIKIMMARFLQTGTTVQLSTKQAAKQNTCPMKATRRG